MLPLIIDTDIGDDVDDAYGLALALAMPELNLLAVTTVAGPTKRRARLVQTFLAAAGRQELPVAAGSSVASDGRPGSDRFSHAAALAPRATLPPLWPGSATDLLVALGTDTTRGSIQNRSLSSPTHTPDPKPRLLIVCLGPLTNLALALQREPQLAGQIAVVAMAGKLGLPYPDWNLRCDPAAARAVLSSGAPVTLVGMHVTMACKLSRSELELIFGARRPLTDLLARCTLAWRTWQRRMPILHDALTVALASDPSLALLEPRKVLVGPYGFSCSPRSAAPNAQVTVKADIPRWRELLLRRLLGHS